MNKTQRDSLKSRLKALSYYQIAGGVYGIGNIIWVISTSIITMDRLFFLVLIIPLTILNSYSIFVGKQLLKGKIENGLKHSMINQALQVFYFELFGYAYQFIAGIGVVFTIDYTDDLLLRTTFSLPTSQLSINFNGDLIIAGLNLIPLFLIRFIIKAQEKIEDLNYEFRL
ncbi:hypothetical protein [Arcicella rigui]|uniref:DUF2975 domain-containing protein n=1 Tax=Arcicella rigui TaxID=797020 RepID=A0ABU5Q5G9_9BACT|nr:hypothetical protein [Arcicella rigui]MEA5137863.1 hypothetical protein [Arcicella rigui]